jgi:phage-related protein
MLEAKGELGSVVESSSALGTAGKIGLTALAAAAVTVGVAAIHMGTEFQTQLTRLYTAAGAPKQAVLDNANAILALGTSVGQTGTAMAEALYHPISAGLDMATALQVVKYAAQEAAISGASLDDTTYSLSSVMKAFNEPASQAENTMASLNAIVGQGDMRFQGFNASVKNWAPTAAQMGISINSMGAGLAYLTDRGNSAEVAATRMTMGISMMTTPSKQAATLLEGLGVASSDVKASTSAMTDVLQKTGITQNKLATDLKQPDGLYVALKDLQDGLKRTGVTGTEADSVLAKVFGGGRSDKAIMSLMQNLDGLKTKFQDISKSSTAKSFEQNWDDARKTFGFQMQQIKAAGENALTHLGTALLPKLSGFIADMGSKGGQAIKQFMAGFSGGGDTSGMAKLGAFIRPIITDLENGGKDVAKAIGNILSAVQPLAKLVAGAFLLGIRAVADVFGHVLAPALAGVTGFLQKNKEIVTVLGGAYLLYKGIMLGIQVATKAWAVVQGILNVVMDANPIMLIVLAVAALALGVVELVKHWSSVVGFFKDVWKSVTGFFNDALHDISAVFDGIVKFALDLPGKIGHALSSLGSLLTHGLTVAWQATLSFLKNLPHEIGFALGFLAGLLVKLAVDGWKGFTHGLTVAWQDTVQWFKDLPGNVKKLNDKAEEWLHEAGANVIHGLWHGITTGFDATVKFFKDLPGEITKHFTDAGEWLHSPGLTVIKGLGRGISDAFEDVVTWFKNLPRNIGGFFKDVGTWLKDAGYNLVMGLIHGIENAASAAWHAVTSFASGLVSGFKSALGISSPSRVMAEEIGKFIPQGIAQGMNDNMHHVTTSAMATRSALLTALRGSAGIGLSVVGSATGAVGGYSGAVTGGSGAPGSVTINITTGALLSTKADIKQAVQEAFLQNGMRNVQNGLTFSAK